MENMTDLQHECFEQEMFKVINSHSDRTKLKREEQKVHNMNITIRKLKEKNERNSFWVFMGYVLFVIIMAIFIWIAVSYIDVVLHNTNEVDAALIWKYNFFNLKFFN